METYWGTKVENNKGKVKYTVCDFLQRVYIFCWCCVISINTFFMWVNTIGSKGQDFGAAWWLALWPHSQKVPGLNPGSDGVFLCGVCMFSPCFLQVLRLHLTGFSKDRAAADPVMMLCHIHRNTQGGWWTGHCVTADLRAAHLLWFLWSSVSTLPPSNKAQSEPLYTQAAAASASGSSGHSSASVHTHCPLHTQLH